MMDRRRFLLTSMAGAFAVPLPAEAQKAARPTASPGQWCRSRLSVAPVGG
jgi:hypothetical protein